MKKKLVIAALAACILLSGCGGAASESTAEATPAPTPAATPEVTEPTEEEIAAETASLDGSNVQAIKDYLQQYRYDDAVNQVLIVAHTDGSNAVAVYYEKQDDLWTPVFQSAAYVGKNGINKTQEGDGKTPCGDFAVTGAFGIQANPGTALDYIDVVPTTYACDEDCEYYNQIIDTAETGHNCKGEEMYTTTPAYEYGMTTSYNEENVYPNGSAIFIHCYGKHEYTAGCVALSQEDILTILTTATPRHAGVHRRILRNAKRGRRPKRRLREMQQKRPPARLGRRPFFFIMRREDACRPGGRAENAITPALKARPLR